MNQGIVYSLIAVVVVLLLGITALLGVAHSRHQRLEDATTDLQRSIVQQEARIVRLQTLLDDCDTLQTGMPADTLWEQVSSLNRPRHDQK